MSDRLLSTRHTLGCLAGAAIFWPIAYLAREPIWYGARVCSDLGMAPMSLPPSGCRAVVSGSLDLMSWPFVLLAVWLSVFGLVGTSGWLAQPIRVARFRLRNSEWPEPIPAFMAEALEGRTREYLQSQS
jgi:hypothetical protein